jgi:hypothetical protein
MSPAERRAVARAEERRSRWSGGRASFTDAAAQDVVFWQQVPGGERLNAVFALAMEWHGPAPAEPSAGRRRSAGGVRKR